MAAKPEGGKADGKVPIVAVPRSELGEWWPKPWPEVISAAESGRLRIVMADSWLGVPGMQFRPREVIKGADGRPEMGPYVPGWDDWSSIAFLAAGRFRNAQG